MKKPEGTHTFEVLPRRWVVERTLSWLVRCRRLGRDYERLPAHAEAMVKWAMIGLMARRLAPARPAALASRQGRLTPFPTLTKEPPGRIPFGSAEFPYVARKE